MYCTCTYICMYIHVLYVHVHTYPVLVLYVCTYINTLISSNSQNSPDFFRNAGVGGKKWMPIIIKEQRRWLETPSFHDIFFLIFKFLKIALGFFSHVQHVEETCNLGYLSFSYLCVWCMHIQYNTASQQRRSIIFGFWREVNKRPKKAGNYVW